MFRGVEVGVHLIQFHLQEVVKHSWRGLGFEPLVVELDVKERGGVMVREDLQMQWKRNLGWPLRMRLSRWLKMCSVCC
jgi:hypothetical protein